MSKSTNKVLQLLLLLFAPTVVRSGTNCQENAGYNYGSNYQRCYFPATSENTATERVYSKGAAGSYSNLRISTSSGSSYFSA